MSRQSSGVTGAVLLTCALAFTACGPEDSSGPRFPIELYISAGLRDDLQAFQLTLVTKGSELDCTEVQKSCINGQVDSGRFVTHDENGQTKSSWSFTLAALQAGSPNEQDVSLKGLKPGSDFALVVEAVSSESPAKLAGSACNYVPKLEAGNNAAVTARIEAISPHAACDPRH